jgi:orotate phosphoribosyltransferase
MVAIFTYGFAVAEENFTAAKCQVETLSNYHVLIEEALRNNYIGEKDLDSLKKWREAPDKWNV